MIRAFSWQISISLIPASFSTPRPNLPVTPGVYCLPTFAFQSPILKKTSVLGVILINSKYKFYLLNPEENWRNGNCNVKIIAKNLVSLYPSVCLSIY